MGTLNKTSFGLLYKGYNPSVQLWWWTFRV